MKHILIAAAAAGTLLTIGVSAVSAGQPVQLAQWSLSSGFRGEGSAPETAYPQAYGQYAPGPACRTITIHERHDGRMVARQIVRC